MFLGRWWGGRGRKAEAGRQELLVGLAQELPQALFHWQSCMLSTNPSAAESQELPHTMNWQRGAELCHLDQLLPASETAD